MSQRIRAILEMQRRHNAIAHNDVGHLPTQSAFRHFSMHIAKYARDFQEVLFTKGSNVNAADLKNVLWTQC